MTEAEALLTIQGLCAAGRWRLTVHARVRMEERNVSTQDMLRAVATAKRAIAKPDDRWSLDGVDRSGDELRVIIAVEGECVVVTVY